MDRIVKMLGLVKTMNWRHTPPNWRDDMRMALTTGLVTVGFGGVLKLTDAGEAMLRKPPVNQ